MPPLFEKIKLVFKSSPVLASLLISAVTFMLIFFYSFEVPRVTHLTNEIQNAGHVPFFGVFTLILLAFIRTLLSKKIKSFWFQYGTAFAASMALGLLFEISQKGTSRTADPMDLMRNVAGGIIALALWYTIDRAAPNESPPRFFLTVNRIRIICFICVLLMLVPILRMRNHYKRRDRAFPVLCDFNERWSLSFIAKSGCWISRVDPPALWTQARGKKVFRVRTSMFPYPRIKIDEPYPDWNGYSALAFNLFSAMKEPFPIEIKIEDYRHDEHYTDRYNKEFIVQPGSNEIRISLDDVRNAPITREMDMRDVRSVTLLLDHPNTRHIFLIDTVRLEK